MSINEGAKKIIQYLLDCVIKEGNLDKSFEIKYDTLTKELGLESTEYCRVCCQYLHDLRYISIFGNNDGVRKFNLKAEGIKFLESM